MQKLNTVVTDNYGKLYDVFVDNTKDKPIIRVKGQIIQHNGSSWYLESLLENRSDRVAIDYGQKWYLNGMHNIYNELGV